MLTDRAHSLASKRVTSWSKHQLPGYWTMFQIVACGGFALFAAVALLRGPSEGVPQAEGVAGFEQSDPQAEPLAAPDDPMTPQDAPDPASPSTAVLDSEGKAVDVPDAAAQTAVAGLKAMFDPAVAATVPVTGGGTLPAPPRAFPDATVGDPIFVADVGNGRLVFAAQTDADGPGTTFGTVTSTITVVNEGAAWIVEVV